MLKLGNGTLICEKKPSVFSYASVVGKKEGEGPMGKYFDKTENDEYNGESSWEKAECGFMKQSTALALIKGGLQSGDMDFVICGDLMNQCTSSGYFARGAGAPFLGVYGACSTMAETLAIGSMIIESGGARYVMCATASHFCSAEKQFRTPLEYGGQRPPTAQWTVTGSGAVILGSDPGTPFVESITVGKVIDYGIKDSNNMGGAMAPAFADTVKRHFEATGRGADYYDKIFSGDLGYVGKELALKLLKCDGIDINGRYEDCGIMMFDRETQDTHAGGSGCGCSASILCGYILPKLKRKEYKRVLFVATGALLSPTVIMQGESIPSVAHAIALEA